MENKEKVQEAIKQTESKISQLGIELANLKAELDKPTRVEVAADGAILSTNIGGYFIGANHKISGACSVYDIDVKYLTTYDTQKQAEDELLRREISCHIRRRACELNDNHDWRKGPKEAYYIGFMNKELYCLSLNYTAIPGVAFFKIEKDAQTVISELNAKYSPETIKRLYFAEAK